MYSKKKGGVLSVVAPSLLLEDERTKQRPTAETRTALAQLLAGPVVDDREWHDKVVDALQPLIAVLAFLTRSTVDGLRGASRLGLWLHTKLNQDFDNHVRLDTDRLTRFTENDNEHRP